MSLRDYISNNVEQNKDTYIKMSDSIWEYAELGFQEIKSVECQIKQLESENFVIERNVSGLPTAFTATFGSGNPVIAILGEYDALPYSHQEKGAVEKKTDNASGNGHGCGHNLLGVGSLAAAIAIKESMMEYGIKGTVRYYGCPAEENGACKIKMVETGAFSDVDIALSWHPESVHSIWNKISLANCATIFKFDGVSSHAAASPHLGRSALDAVELMNVGVNFLREHVESDARIHYAITDAGAKSPNVVQPHAEVFYFVRSPRKKSATEILERVNNIAHGAALMTGTKVEICHLGTVANLIPNNILASVMHKHQMALGVPKYDEETLDFAEQIKKSLTSDEIRASLNSVDFDTADKIRDKVIADVIPPLLPIDVFSGSTDVGNVSWAIPTMQCTVACWALGTALHSWQAVSQNATPIAHQGMLLAAKIIACTAVDLMLDPKEIEKAKVEFKKRIAQES